MADGHEVWAAVTAAVPDSVRLVAYDRAGLGDSDPDPRPRTVRRMAEDLREVLTGIGPGPFILVGHSIGGPITRLVAAANPTDVAGLLLVDPTDESLAGFYSPLMRRMIRTTLATLPLQARLGMLARRHRRRVASLPAELAAAATPRRVRTAGARAEYRSFVAGLAEIRDASPAPPAVPVTVLSAGGPRARADVQKAHARYVGGLARGRHVVVPDSGHDIHLQRPDLVAEELLRLVHAPSN